MTEQIYLFNSDSVDVNSLNHFTIDKQMTVIGFGLSASEYVTFEMALFDTPETPTVCDPCAMPPVTFPGPTAYQELKCCDGTAIRLSAANPIVLLGSPTNTRIRAVYHGFTFGSTALTADVRAYSSRPVDIRSAHSGCCGATCGVTTTTTDALLDCGNAYVGLLEHIVRTTVVTDTCSNTVTTTVTYRLADDESAPWLTISPCIPV